MKNFVINIFFGATFLMVLVGCGNESPSPVNQPEQNSPKALNSKLSLVANPAGELSAEPNLVVSNNGEAYLSWVELFGEDSSSLRFARFDGESWIDPKTIAEGDNWFVNWADFPSLVVSSDNSENLAAHWLAMRAEGTYDYDIKISQSADGGKNWSAPFIPHTDNIAAEHGFVSMKALPNGKIFAAWLDGRLTKTEAESHKGHDHGHGGGPMTLRTATFDKTGRLSEEAELDAKVCDCCQTDVAITANGPVVVYRDRSDKEIRDISIVRRIDGGWTPPKTIYEDNWEISGCPVNGPAIAAEDLAVAVAWFSSAKEKSTVKLAFSNDAGANFGKPIQINTNKTIGRVDLLLVKRELAFVCWMEESSTKTEIRAAYFSSEGRQGAEIVVSDANASRRSGFPRLAKLGDDFLVAWTAVQGDSTKIKTAIITAP